MLSKKKEKFEPLGEVDVSKLQPLVDLDNIEELKTKRETYEIILKMKERERKYYKIFLLLIIMNLILTGIVVYLGIVRIV